MFCTKCGAHIPDTDRFCPKCGNPAKRGGATEPQKSANADYDPYVISISPERAAELMLEQTTAPKQEKKGSKKRKKAGFILSALLIVLLMLICVGLISNSLDATTPQEMIDALTHSGTEEEYLPASESDGPDIFILGEDEFPATTSTAETTTVTTTTTTTTTTATQQDPLIFQAKEIRDLLIAKKWKTTIDGYDAVITFKDDNTALIEVNVKLGFFNVNQKINADFEITPKCFAKIVGEYNGTKYGISGIISKVSDSELIVDRGEGRGTITLKEVK